MAKKAKREELSRVRILTKYDLSSVSLDVLEGMGLLKGDFEYKRGKAYLEVTKEDDFTLRCARNDLRSFPGTTLPFHRFLCLRFINTSIEEIQEEIFRLDLLPSRKVFTIAALKKIKAEFMKRLPKELSDLVKKGREPKNKTETARLDHFLTVLGVSAYYARPDLLEDLRSLMPLKSTVDPFLTTACLDHEVSEALSKIVGEKVPDIAVSSYRIVFHAVGEMNDQAFEKYLTFVEPTRARMFREARRLTFQEFAAKRGLDVVEYQEVLKRLMMEKQKLILNAGRFKSAEMVQAHRAAVDAYLKIYKVLEDAGSVGKESRKKISDIFGKFIVKKVSGQGDVPLRRITDLEGEAEADVG
jgi:hypothetical protein